MKYYCLHNFKEIPKCYVDEAISSTYQQSHRPNQLKAPSSFNKSNIINIIKQRFGEVGGLYIKNKPRTYYDWHVDIGRQCSVNWVLKNNNGITLYRELVPPLPNCKSITYDIEEVEYVLYKPTILDTSKEHCIINNTDEDRIIFSLSIDAPFIEVKEFLCGIKNI